MRRILFVLRGDISEATVAHCCFGNAADPGIEVAICYELPPSHDGVVDSIAVQRRITVALRQAHGTAAEAIAVFAARDRDGERARDYATAWGATEVIG